VRVSDHTHLSGYVQQAIKVTAVSGSTELEKSWNQIVVPAEAKERLVNHALMVIELRRGGISSVELPLHGLIVMSGPPGVGKTSLARGLGYAVSQALDGKYGQVRVAEINLHTLPSELLGRTQRNIIQLFEEELPALAEDGPVVVVLDEMEVLAVSRAKTSLEINPADVFRGTAALLAALDWFSQNVPGAVVVGTTNLPEAVDDAVFSRADLWLDLPMPSEDVVREILSDTFASLARRYPESPLPGHQTELAALAHTLRGRDGRQVRKFVADALALRAETAMNPGLLSFDQLMDCAARSAGPATLSPSIRSRNQEGEHA
jgi:SpoVK/Ycf46/Vps4 family AAA+-type ATPase